MQPKQFAEHVRNYVGDDVMNQVNPALLTECSTGACKDMGTVERFVSTAREQSSPGRR